MLGQWYPSNTPSFTFQNLIVWYIGKGLERFPFFGFDWLLNCVVFEETIVASNEANQEENYIG